MCKATRAASSPVQTTLNPLWQHQTLPSVFRQRHNLIPNNVDKMPGFDFSNHNRNVALHARGVPLPKATSTGTTIVGCLYDGGVVIAADTRATSGPIVADKNCEKLHYISPQIWCAGAGTAADTEFTTALMSSNLELHALSTGRKPRVVTVMTMLKQHLFRYQGHIGAYLVVAGCDPTGAHLFTVHAHGSTDKLPYVTMGSGSLAAMSVFETTWKNDLTRDQAVKLCSEAIQAGIWNDLGSGSNVDVCVITEEKTELLRNYITPNVREQKMRDYKFARGTTAVLDQKIITKEEISKYVTVQDLGDGEAGVGEKMEVDT
jgi:20S proteasome subunit beta 2